MVKQGDAADGGGRSGGGVIEEIKRRTKEQSKALAVASEKFKKGKKARHAGAGSRRYFSPSWDHDKTQQLYARLCASSLFPFQVETKNMQDRKLRGQLRDSERLAKDAATSAARVSGTDAFLSCGAPKAFTCASATMSQDMGGARAFPRPPPCSFSQAEAAEKRSAAQPCVLR